MATTVFALFFVSNALLHVVVTSTSDYWTRRHLGNLKLYAYNGTDSSPDDIHRVDMQITATAARKDSSSHPVHAIRVSWSPARNAAAYRVHCEVNTTDEVVTILDKEILNGLTEIEERFVLPRGPLSVICCVAAANADGASLWTYSPMLTIPSLNMKSASDSITQRGKSSASSEDLTTDQLLRLIHKSEAVDLPTKPIQRRPEEPIVIRPKHNRMNFVQKHEESQPHENLMNFDLNEKDLERDYETLEKDIRESIGATDDDTPKSGHRDSLKIFGFLNRVL